MPHLITAAEISAMADTPWTAPQTKRAEMLLRGIDGWLERNAPCLLSADGPSGAIDEGREVVAEAVLRAISAGTSNVASSSETIGPNSHAISRVDRAALPTLTSADEARLRALCPSPRRRRRAPIMQTRIRPGY